jgi:hypothetical protein
MSLHAKVFRTGGHILSFHILFIISIVSGETHLAPWAGSCTWEAVFKKEKAFFAEQRPLGAGTQIRISFSCDGITSIFDII